MVGLHRKVTPYHGDRMEFELFKYGSHLLGQSRETLGLTPSHKEFSHVQNKTIISSRSLSYLRFFLEVSIQRCTFVPIVANYCIRNQR